MTTYLLLRVYTVVMVYVKLYVAMLVVFLVIDAIWLSVMTPLLYGSQLEHLLADEINFWAAGVFYVLFVLATLILVVLPFRHEKRPYRTVMHGAILGLICYATYDLTNQATIREWPLLVTMVDIAWGTALGAMTAYGGYVLRRWLQL